MWRGVIPLNCITLSPLWGPAGSHYSLKVNFLRVNFFKGQFSTIHFVRGLTMHLSFPSRFARLSNLYLFQTVTMANMRVPHVYTCSSRSAPFQARVRAVAKWKNKQQQKDCLFIIAMGLFDSCPALIHANLGNIRQPAPIPDAPDWSNSLSLRPLPGWFFRLYPRDLALHLPRSLKG